MKTTTYKRYNGTTIIKDDSGICVGKEYHTGTVSFIWPKHIESVYRYLRRFEPNSKYLLDWNPLHTPSFGMWLEITPIKIRMRSRCAHHLNKNDIDIIFDTSTPLLRRLAIRSIMNILQWYGSIRKQRNPLTLGNSI